MRTVSMLLLVFVGCMSESHSGNRSTRAKRELLLRSKRRWVLSTVELTEETPGPYPTKISHMFNDKMEKDSERQQFKLSGMGVTEKPLGVFSINEETGEVYAHGPVDREEYSLFHLKFEILDKDTGLQIDRELSIDIEIMDINDNAPTFANSRITANIKENSEEGYLPVQLQAMDRDQTGTPNSNVTISVISQKPQQPVIAVKQIDDRMAQLTLAGCFNYDKIKNYEVIVQAKDQGTPSLSSTAIISLNIVDTNTHPPVFKETKYKGEVSESTIKRDVLRVAVEDKDTPNTPGWRAKYFFINGNEDGAFEIETDPETNEGILSVIKEMDFERTTSAELQIGVENEEKFFVCKDGSTGNINLPPPNSVTVTIEVIDFNDPPQFKKEITDVYRREEEPPGKLLFTPEVHDVDSPINNIRYVLLHDPAEWMGIDAKTGQVKTIKIMDRESPFVNKDSIYNITIGAVDDGKPQATGKCIVLVHLTDINDNTPRLVNNHVIMCGNKVNKVMIAAGDTDDDPYSGPFIFSLRDDDGTLTQLWKLEPSVGEEGGLVSLKTLPYGNYTVPLVIQDQQSMRENSTLGVTVCDCGEASVCRRKEPLSTSAEASCIGVIFAGLLLFLLLLLIFMCQCGKTFNHVPLAEDEGNQTLIKYNQEGGGAESMSKPVLPSTPTNGVAVTEGLKKATRQVSENDAGKIVKKDAYNAQSMNLNNSTMGGYHMDSDFRGFGRQNRNSSWNTNRSQSFQKGSAKQYQRSFSLQSQQHIIDQIDKKLPMIDGGHVDYPQYKPHEYAYEGEGSRSQSLDKLSIANLGDDLQFLNDLEPNFKILGNICHRAIQEKEHAALKNTAGN